MYPEFHKLALKCDHVPIVSNVGARLKLNPVDRTIIGRLGIPYLSGQSHAKQREGKYLLTSINFTTEDHDCIADARPNNRTVLSVVIDDLVFSILDVVS